MWTLVVRWNLRSKICLWGSLWRGDVDVCGKEVGHAVSSLMLKDVRLSFRALSSSEMDMAIMEQLMAFSNSFTSSFHKTPHERSRLHTMYYHQRKSICNVMFCFLHGISKNKLYNITRSLMENGLTPTVHGNTKRLPVHTLTLKSVEYVVRFGSSYCHQALRREQSGRCTKRLEDSVTFRESSFHRFV